MIWRAIFVSLATVVVAHAGSPQAATATRIQSSASSTEAEKVVRSFVDAYNRHDIPGLLTLADPDIEWLSVEADTVRAETRGRDALGRSLTSYFKQFPTSQSTIDSVVSNGPWVAARERAEWTDKTGPRSQSSLSVYEIHDGRVRRVWYYPVVR